MSKLTNSGCFWVILITIAVYAISWAITCGILFLITLCFDLEFKLLTATGIWLIICILQSIFKNTVTVKK